LSIHIIIDGYNLIRQSPELEALDRRDIQLGRDALLQRLVAYKKIKRHKITVVFDGGGAPVFADHHDSFKGIAVKFSRTGETADMLINRMVKQEKERALVVTSDREVAAYCMRQGATIIPSPDFDAKLALAAYTDLKGDTDEENSGWVPTTRKKGPRRKLSKRERRRRARVEKL
jgi:uncharacterized protein